MTSKKIEALVQEVRDALNCECGINSNIYVSNQEDGYKISMTYSSDSIEAEVTLLNKITSDKQLKTYIEDELYDDVLSVYQRFEYDEYAPADDYEAIPFHVTIDDFDGLGFDVSGLSKKEQRHIVDRLSDMFSSCDGVMEYYWEHIRCVAEEFGLKQTEEEPNDTDIERAIKFVRKNIDMDDVRYIRGCVDKHHSCVRAENPDMLTRIYDLMEEYGADNDLSEGWWLDEMDEEEIFDEL